MEVIPVIKSEDARMFQNYTSILECYSRKNLELQCPLLLCSIPTLPILNDTMVPTTTTEIGMSIPYTAQIPF